MKDVPCENMEICWKNYSRCSEAFHEEFISNGADPINISDSTFITFVLSYIQFLFWDNLIRIKDINKTNKKLCISERLYFP